MRENYHPIRDDWEVAQILHRKENVIKRCAFLCVNLTAETELALSHTYKDCIFLGCSLPVGFKKLTRESLFFPNMGQTFHFCSHLYTPEELYEGYETGNPESYEDCYDGIVYKHYLKMGKKAINIKETLARSLHDHSITDCMDEFLSHYDERSLVGIMGGHSLLRTDKAYKQIAILCKTLSEKGFLLISGGGPGAMEATHLGAWMADRSREELMEAIEMLSVAPCYKDKGWLDSAMRVREKFPQLDYKSLGIPTWLYGHEPSTPFATHIAKYFENSIREDGLLTIAKGGIIYTPGSAGTLQEIFQEAVQDHYLSYGYASPMIFVDKQFWSEEIPVWGFIQDLVARGKYKNLLLTLSDSPDEIVDTLLKFRNEGKD